MMDARWASDITPIAARVKYVLIQPSWHNDRDTALVDIQTSVNSMVAKAVTDGIIPVLVVPDPSSAIASNPGTYQAHYDALCAWVRTFPLVLDGGAVVSDPWDRYSIRPDYHLSAVDAVHCNFTGNKAKARAFANATFWDFPRPSAYQKITTNTYTAPTTTAYGPVVSASSSAPLGYTTGAGGSGPQGTSKSTGVTLNKITGQITMHNAALAAGAAVSFTFVNSTIAATDIVLVTIASGATANAYTVNVTATAAGSCRVQLTNISGGSLGEAVVLNFAVIKGASATHWQSRPLGNFEEYPLAV